MDKFVWQHAGFCYHSTVHVASPDGLGAVPKDREQGIVRGIE